MNEKLSFEEFYKRFYRRTYCYVKSKIGHIQEAEDLTCDVFLYCYKHFAEYNPEKASIETWLYVIVNSRIKNYYRDRKSSVDIDSLTDVLPDENVPLERAMELENMRQLLAVALKALSPVQREIVILRYFHGDDTNTVAEKLGLQSGNVRTTLSRALDRLEKYFKAHGIETFIWDT